MVAEPLLGRNFAECLRRFRLQSILQRGPPRVPVSCQNLQKAEGHGRFLHQVSLLHETAVLCVLIRAPADTEHQVIQLSPPDPIPRDLQLRRLRPSLLLPIPQLGRQYVLALG